MRNTSNQLDDILYAKDAVQRERAVKVAKKKLADMSAKDWVLYANEFGPWVNDISLLRAGKKKEQKKANKLYKSLINIVEAKNQIATETRDELIEAITHCDDIEELEMLYAGKTHHQFKHNGKLYRVTTPNLAKRAHDAKLPKNILQNMYDERRQYLKKKKVADGLALGLNATLSILGIGLIGAIATMAILPVMPLVAFIPTLIVFAVLGGYVEGFVYHGYVQKFCRNMVRGFYESIENNILNRVYGKKKWLSMTPQEQQAFMKANHIDKITEALYRDLGRKAWLTLSKQERKDTLAQHRKELVAKKILATAIIPIAISSGIGFGALAFTQFAGLLTIVGVASTSILAVVAPWVLAVIVAPLYAMIMYSMIHNAIKNNVFLQMRDNAVALFKRKEGQSTPAYVVLCGLKALGFLLVLAISVTATVFSAGAWLESSIGFFSAAVGLVEKVATTIGAVIGSLFLGTGLWFSIEKSLETAKAMMDFSFNGLKKIFTSPKRFFLSLIDAIPLGIHFVATGATDALGTEVVLNIPPSTHARLAVTAIGMSEEFLVDAKDYSASHSHSHHGHSHGGLSGHLVSIGKSVASFFAKITGREKKVEEVDLQIPPRP